MFQVNHVNMEILKNAKEQISTIFEVLLYDPLHNWSISPEKACMLQRNQTEFLSDAASDSLIVVNEASSRSVNSNASLLGTNTDATTNKSSLLNFKL